MSKRRLLDRLRSLATSRAVVVALSLLLLVDALARMVAMVPGTFETNYADFKSYHWAGRRVAQSRASELYAEHDFNTKGRRVRVKDFKNIPIVAAAFVPFGRLPYPDAWRAWWITSLVGGLAGFLAACAWVRRFSPSWITYAVVMFWAATHYYPIARSFRFGQTSQIVTSLLFFAYLSLESRREVLAGLLLGLGAVIKIPLTVFAVLLLGTRRWRAAAAFFAVGVAAVSLSVALFGFEVHREWYRVVIDENLGMVFTAENNQSFIAEGMRLTTESNSELVRYTPVPLPGGIALTQWAAVLGIAAFWARARRRVPGRLVTGLDFSLCIGIMPVLYPVFWIHYFLFSLVPMLILWRIVIQEVRSRQVWYGTFLAGIYFAIALFPDKGARYYTEIGTNLWIDLWLGRYLASSIALVIFCFSVARQLARGFAEPESSGAAAH